MAITLVGKALAFEGSEFCYMGPLECEGCKLKGVCFNLEPGERYRVISVRGQEHPCAELEDEVVVAVEVEKVPTPAILPKKGLLEGVTVTFSESKCTNMACRHWGLCHPTGRTEGSKYTVVRMGEDVDCPEGGRLAYVDLV